MRKDYKYRNAIKTYAEWQLDPSSITSKTVQLWSPDILLTSEMPLIEAQEFVKTGKCFVITSQAIGFINKG